MREINNFYSYMFYRLTKPALTEESGNEINGIVWVTFSQVMILVNFLSIFLYCFFENPLRKELFNYSKILVVIIYFLLSIRNYKIFYNNYVNFREKWKDEDRKIRNVKMIFVVLAISVPLLAPITYLIFKP
ncbi:MAG: hypothetical protein IPP27_09615 [Bacteroidetes bacterium]|nr:hypothetical protein [Bacteroidota bacterium]MBK9412858.1 hypothetical protein [Bacteroidota bacterium]MBL0032407.1 hypothetical protein [Bacteroidota bacterium]MBP6425980.1 hypothetical protein [Bacteroidia bacterium]MBP6658418.1 hypothetical protein [Bacteroidia bacterium]